ncbi:MAG: carboxypeptidase-like regulatory domain-containing protein, partial [Bacteroidota bacterium]
MKLLTRVSLLLVFLSSSITYGQNTNLADVEIDGFYDMSFVEFLDRVEKDYGVEFLFDRDAKKYQKIEISQRYFNQPLDKVLNQIAKKYHLEYTINEAGAVSFIEGGLKDPNAFETYKGAPTKQNLTISGRVTDAKTGETLPSVNINVKGTLRGTSTNLDGYFTLFNVPTDTSTIVFSYLGYNNFELSLNPMLKFNDMKIELIASTTQLEEIVVTSTRDDILQVNRVVGMVKLTPAKLNLLPNLGEKDIFRSFQLLPGVSAANENSSGLYIRGGTPDQALVTYDGFTVYHVDHLFGFFSAFNSNAIKDVNLYKGGFESKYGGRISGVAEITGKDGNQKNFNFGGDISLLSANLYTEIPIGDKFTMLFAGRRSWKGPIYNSIFETFGPEEPQAPTQFGNRPGFSTTSSTVASYFYDLNGKLTFRPTGKDVISLSIYNGMDNLDNSSEIPSSMLDFGSFSANTTDITEWGNTGASLKWSRQWTDKLYVNSLLSYSSYFSNRDRSNTRTITPSGGEERTIKAGLLEENNIEDVSFKADVQYQISSDNTLEFGTQITNNNIDYSYSQNDTISIISRDDNAKIYAFYAQDKIRLFNQKLLITPGLRYTYYDVTGKNYFEPRLSANYLLTDDITLKAATGRYYQFAKRVIREDVLQGSKDFWVMADGNTLPVTMADHYIAGASYEKNGFVFDVEGYYKRLQGLSEYSLRFTADQGGITYDDSFFEGTGSTIGIDFLLQKSIERYSGWAGYTLSETMYNFPEFGVDDFPSSNDVT